MNVCCCSSCGVGEMVISVCIVVAAWLGATRLGWLPLIWDALGGCWCCCCCCLSRSSPFCRGATFSFQSAKLFVILSVSFWPPLVLSFASTDYVSFTFILNAIWSNHMFVPNNYPARGNNCLSNRPDFVVNLDTWWVDMNILKLTRDTVKNRNIQIRSFGPSSRI